MKKILLPIDYSPLSEELIGYVGAMSKDIPVREVVLIKSFHIPGIAKIMPSADLTLLSDDTVEAQELSANNRIDELAERLRQLIGYHVEVRSFLFHDPWTTMIKRALEMEHPDLLVLGHDLAHGSAEDQMSETVVTIAQLSRVPVLLIPAGATYFLPKHMLLPTTFRDIERLRDFKNLFTANLWRGVVIDILQIGNDIHPEEQEMVALYDYLQGYRFVVHRGCGPDVAEEILRFADTKDAGLIFALPGRHSFIYQLVHKSVTKKFALLSKRPVLLLK